MNKRSIFLIVLLAVLVAAVIVYRKVAAATPQATDRAAEIAVPAKDLYDAFVSDEAAAGKDYNDKVVQVTGRIREVNVEADGRLNVLLETGDPLGAVVCEFSSGAGVDTTRSAALAIKGFCAGYNMDVLLQRCAVVK